MIDLVVEACQVVTSRVVLCGNEEVIPGFPHVEDRHEAAGPLAGIEALLQSGIDKRYLVIPCDMPGLRGDDLAGLCKARGELVVFKSEPGAPIQGLPMVIDATLAEPLAGFISSGQRAVHRFIASIEHTTVPSPSNPRALLNINSPAEWEAFLESSD
jgi:molybdopterin-guanine dinucleotide biosynthesis protein A